uniref:Uncharacterized protein n=1 Tax=Anguilla anguilla TaxID=7936 RepID=A0A0E9QYM1_ANGAN
MVYVTPKKCTSPQRGQGRHIDKGVLPELHFANPFAKQWNPLFFDVWPCERGCTCEKQLVQ